MKKNSYGVKKLLILVNELNPGGAEHMIYELVKNINRNKYNPEILCYGQYHGNSLEEKCSEVCNVRYLGLSGKISIKTVRKVFSAINQIDPDIVHAHQGGVSFAVPWCTIHRAPLCITVHSTPKQAFSPINNRMIKILKKVLNMVVVAVSEENLLLIRKYYNLSHKKSEFVNNGINIESFYKVPHEKFTFINVARQDDNKNQIAIIRAVAKIIKSGKNVDLLLVGDGPCHDKLRTCAESLGIRDYVKFTGQVSDTSGYYAQSDVYVQSSYREAMPLSVLEAMAAGLPIIATNVGGLKDVVKENGILVDAGDEEALYEAMSRMLNASQTEYEEMATHSKEMVKDFSSVRMAEQYERIYNKFFKN